MNTDLPQLGTRRANVTKAIIFGILLPVFVLPICVFISCLQIPRSHMDSEFKAWFPIVCLAITLSYSLLLAPFVVIANVHLFFRRGISRMAIMYQGMIPPFVILIGGIILFRIYSEAMVAGAEKIWCALGLR